MNTGKDWENTRLHYLAICLFFFALVITCGTLIHVIFGAITNYDSLTAHMARVMYYRQFGKIGYYGANYWAQDMHPYVLPFIQLFLIKVTNWENSAILVQWFSLLITCVFSGLSCFRIAGNKYSGIICGLLIFFFVNAVIQSTTTQNDLVLTAVLAVQLFICVSQISLSKKYLFLYFFLLLGLGVKQTFILYQVPILLTLAWRMNFKIKSLFFQIPFFRLFIITIIISPIFLFHMIDSYRNIGSPFGFKDVLDSHSFVGLDFLFITKAGTRNLIRYLFDFFTMDGLNAYPSISSYFLKINNFFKWHFAQMIMPITGNLEKGSEIRVGFFYLKRFSMQDSSSFWGPVGPLLIFPSFLISIISDIRKKKLMPAGLMGVCILSIFLTQSYSSFYDMWRGRYFNEAIPFASCLATLVIQKYFSIVYFRFWIISSLILSGFACFGSVFLRSNCSILKMENSISLFHASREEIMTSKNIELMNTIRFLSYLPANVDSFGLYTSANMPEYILFDFAGKRKFFPLNSHAGISPWKNIMTDAILFTDDVIRPSEKDHFISSFGVNGEKLYYRKTK